MKRGLLATVMVALSLPILRLAPASASIRESSMVSSGAVDILSDFNGDGFADLAVGVPEESVNGISDAGAVNVLYGASGGLQADSPDDQFWNQDSAGVRGAAETTDAFGWALATGDFNGDGFDDLAVNAYGEWVGSKYSAGAVNVLYGSAAGLQADAPDDQYWHQDSTGVRDKAESGDHFGTALAAGDFNTDGYEDLAIGVDHEGVGTKSDAGAVAVLYGGSGGLQADAPDDDWWNQDSTGIRDMAEANDSFGAALATGDFDADGFSDLAIGIRQEDVGSLDSAGAAAVLYGGAGGLQAGAPDDDYWNQNSSGVQGEPNTFDTFGSALAGADFNDDGFDDLAIGVTNETVSGFFSAGAVNVLYGSVTGLQAANPDDDYWHQDSQGVLDQAEGIDQFGNALAAGDFNQDGIQDLAVGVVSELGLGPATGAAEILYGSVGGLQASAPDDQLWSQNSDGVQGEAGGRFGQALAARDFNGDGFADLAVGVVEEVGGAENAGAANVLFGAAGGLQAFAPDDQFWDQDSPGVQDEAEKDDEFGDALA